MTKKRDTPTTTVEQSQVKGRTESNAEEDPELEMEKTSTTEDSRESDLIKEREKSEDYFRRLQYLQADFENYRKRVDREISDVRKYGNERLLSELLLINDEFELGLKRARDQGSNPSMIEGFEMVLKRLQGLLAKEGVVRVEGVGRKFDPAVHEAALRVMSDKEEGTIIEEIRSGYTLRGRLLRPSIVKVAGEAENEELSSEKGQYKMANGNSGEEKS